ncbi:MAG: F0F1 ATP synthase subunit delta [Streptococcaceae bacterium]|jgi:F-type H+-transporting ATPase subunit delta|nr:F0F1 ATP synthase subunit delta [Streptococcaceae bacterium]
MATNTTIIARKYAKALIEAAKEPDKIETLLSEAMELEKSIEACHAQSFLADDIVPDAQKNELLNKIADNASEMMGNLLRIIAENGRFSLLSLILKEYKSLANKTLGHDEVEVISPVTLTETQITKMINVIKTKFDLKNVTIINQIDEKILGGFIIKNNVKVLDASIKSQLAKIAAEL